MIIIHRNLIEEGLIKIKKLRNTAELMWGLGIIFVAFGVAICSKANLGVSMIAAPAFILSEAFVSHLPALSVGVTEYIIQGFMLVAMCFVVGRFNWRYLLAFASAVIYGYTLNLFLWILGGVQFNGLALRWVMLIVGDSITALGVACFFRTYLPLQVYELFVAELAARFRWSVNKVKWSFDISLLAISIVLSFILFDDASNFNWSSIYYNSFHSIGLGTLVTTVINSPIIAFFSKVVDKVFDKNARFPKLEKVLKIR